MCIQLVIKSINTSLYITRGDGMTHRYVTKKMYQRSSVLQLFPYFAASLSSLLHKERVCVCVFVCVRERESVCLCDTHTHRESERERERERDETRRDETRRDETRESESERERERRAREREREREKERERSKTHANTIVNCVEFPTYAYVHMFMLSMRATAFDHITMRATH